MFFGVVEIDGSNLGKGDVEGSLDGAKAFAGGGSTVGASAGNLIGGAEGFRKRRPTLEGGVSWFASRATTFGGSFEANMLSGRSPACHGGGVYEYLGKVKDFLGEI